MIHGDTISQNYVNKLGTSLGQFIHRNRSKLHTPFTFESLPFVEQVQDRRRGRKDPGRKGYRSPVVQDNQ